MLSVYISKGEQKMKLKPIKIGYLAFLIIIVVVIHFILQDYNIIDIIYLIGIVVYFLKYLIIEKSS